MASSEYIIKRILITLYKFYIKERKTKFYIENLRSVITSGIVLFPKAITNYVKLMTQMGYFNLNDNIFELTDKAIEDGKRFSEEEQQKFQPKEKSKLEEQSMIDEKGFYKY